MIERRGKTSDFVGAMDGRFDAEISRRYAFDAAQQNRKRPRDGRSEKQPDGQGQGDHEAYDDVDDMLRVFDQVPLYISEVAHDDGHAASGVVRFLSPDRDRLCIREDTRKCVLCDFGPATLLNASGERLELGAVSVDVTRRAQQLTMRIEKEDAENPVRRACDLVGQSRRLDVTLLAEHGIERRLERHGVVADLALRLRQHECLPQSDGIQAEACDADREGHDEQDDESRCKGHARISYHAGGYWRTLRADGIRCR